MDLNVDIGTLVKGLFGGKKDSGSNAGPPPNPHLRSIIVGVVLAGLVGAYLYFFYLPEQKRIQEMQALINSISDPSGDHRIATPDLGENGGIRRWKRKI